MGYVYRLINPPAQPAPERTRRAWLVPGQVASLGRKCGITLFHDRSMGLFGWEYTSRVEARSGHNRLNLPITPGTMINLVDWCGLYALPIAMEYDNRGRPARLRMQFVAMDDAVRWAS